MGYLEPTLAAMRAARSADSPAPRWSEAEALAWLTAMPGDFTIQRAAMVAAIGARLGRHAGKLGPAALARALTAMAEVRRECFVCPLGDDLAYLPAPLAIGADQIMSHPELVALLAAAADPQGGDVLDIGTGSGYQAAVLARMARQVQSIEIIAPLARLAARRLAREGFDNVRVEAGDAALAQLPAERFDAIVVAAGAARVPRALLGALRPGGRLVMPIGPNSDRELLTRIVRRREGGFSITRFGPVRFVPLTGAGARRTAGQARALSSAIISASPTTSAYLA